MDPFRTIDRVIGHGISKFHTVLYRTTHGYIGHKMPGYGLYLLLHATGTKTGISRTVALTYARDGRDFLVVASMAGAPKSPGRYHNLRAAPTAEINVGTQRFAVHVQALNPGDADYARLWRIVNDASGGRYESNRDKTSRPIPVVVLTPDPYERGNVPLPQGTACHLGI
jgi:deazaflavin-dependent oxidoreductase (nitroreductase family)